MENITVGQIIAILMAVVGALKALQYLFGFLQKKADAWLANGLQPIDDKLNVLNEKIDNVDREQCKNFLTVRMAEARNEDLPSVEKERMYDVYEHYTELGGNSYIHTEWERLKKDGRI